MFAFILYCHYHYHHTLLLFDFLSDSLTFFYIIYYLYFLNMKTNFPSILFPESPDVWENIRKLAGEQQKNKKVKILLKKKENGWEEEKQTKGINIVTSVCKWQV